jgi:hypothetical protein
VKSPVMKALVNATLQEQELRELALRTTVNAHLDLPAAEGDRSGWPLFKAWCEQRDITPYPARPASIAFFILENTAMGIAELLRIVKSISLVHETVADPTASGAVPAALNKIAPIVAPRSWPNGEKARFQQLPYDLQIYFESWNLAASQTTSGRTMVAMAASFCRARAAQSYKSLLRMRTRIGSTSASA